MDITIKARNSQQRVFELNSIRWKLLMARYKKINIFQFLAGIIFLYLGIINREKVIPKDINIGISLGIAFILLGAIYSYHNYVNKKKFYRKIQILSKRIEKNHDEILIHITGESIRYEDFELSQELKWSLISHYKIYNDLLFLIMDEHLLTSIIIDKNLITEEEFSELYSFVKNKLIEKK